MRRRDFLTASAAALTATAAILPVSAEEPTPNRRPLFELRNYKFATAAKQKAFAEFLGQTAVPAYNRAGVQPVGLFQLFAKDNPKLKLDADPLELWVFLPHDTLGSFLTLESKLAADSIYQDAGKSILTGLKSEAAFLRYDSMLLHAMVNFTSVVPPAPTPDRIFELRTYESPNPERAANKLEMFNAGEFGAFERAGMPGVFFGGAIAGEGLPQLTYMVAHEKLDTAAAHWTAFGNDAAWKKLKEQPQYKDNVSKIIDRFVRPLPGSQI